ncbi:MAG: ORF6N domain-containing protein [Chlorobi bacterium]|nr:ORF6N domain-containing protein [Chlorobiota bacterium]
MNDEIQKISVGNIKSLLFTIRRQQVMLDSDLAKLYGVDLKRLNEQVKRNVERFPERYRFQLTNEEWEKLKSQFVESDNNSLRSQIATLKNKRGKHRKYLPYVFTEQGVSMLSAVLHSETAVKVSIQIIDAFVEMKKFLSASAGIFQRLDKIERRQVETDQKFEMVFKALQDKNEPPKQGIFYDGQIFDAYNFVVKLIKSAKKSIVLIDNYVDESVLTLLSKNQNIEIKIFTSNLTKQLQLDVEKYNEQYKPIEIKKFKHSHDRFMIIDNKEVYHFGASLKDLGKKWFAFSKFDADAIKILGKLK